MRKVGAAVIIARWWRQKIGPYLYLWHWHGVRWKSAIIIQVCLAAGSEALIAALTHTRTSETCVRSQA